MSKTYNTAKCEGNLIKAENAFDKFMNTTADDQPGFFEISTKLLLARSDAEKTYQKAVAEDYRIQQELDYACSHQ